MTKELIDDMHRVKETLQLLDDAHGMDCYQVLKKLVIIIFPTEIQGFLLKQQGAEVIKSNAHGMKYIEMFKMLAAKLHNPPRELRNRMSRMQQIANLLDNPLEDCFKMLERLTEIILPQRIHDDLCKERVTFFKKLVGKGGKTDYFKLFTELTKKKGDKYKLLEELLNDMHEVLVKKLCKELNRQFQMLLIDESPQLIALLREHTVQVGSSYVSEILKKSIECLQEDIATETLQELLSNETWLKMKEKFVAKLSQDGLIESLQNVLVKKMLHSAKTVMEHLVEEGFYPFIEIGKLTLKEKCNPTLECPS